MTHDSALLPAPDRKVFIKTYGCQMNVYDSHAHERCAGRDGYVRPAMEDADLVLLNTCHIREKAAEKVYSALGKLRDMKKREAAQAGREIMIGVAGCVAQAEGDEILRRAPAVDVVIGPQTYHRLPEALRSAKAGGQRDLDTEYAVEDKFEHLPAPDKADPRPRRHRLPDRAGRLRQVLHLLRRALYPRLRSLAPRGQIVADAERLAEAGVREITLLGQNVNAWHGEGPDGKPVGAGRRCSIASPKSPAIARCATRPAIRATWTTPDRGASRPAGADALPASAGPVRFRPHPEGDEPAPHAAEYLALIERIRTARPDIALSGDFIVGFPGETDEDFEDTLRLVEEVVMHRPSRSNIRLVRVRPVRT
jgi:tRNA-2-methylthio-N6-dimethylallyladenosine synthase